LTSAEEDQYDLEALKITTLPQLEAARREAARPAEWAQIGVVILAGIGPCRSDACFRACLILAQAIIAISRR
jgi:hypothetical protein